jgi:hypothetical protein
MTIKPTFTKPRLRGGLIRYLVLCGILVSLVQTLYAQTTPVTMPSRNTTAQAIVQEIENQTDYKIAVNWDNLDPEAPIVLSAATLPAKEVLDQMLSGTGDTWESIHGQIVIGKETVSDYVMNPISAIMRNDFSSAQLRFVPDPWSKTQEPIDNMVNTRVVRINDENGRDSTGMIMVNYRVNSSTVQLNFMNNEHALAALNRTFQDRDILASLDYMVITAGSSPEGNEKTNEELAAKRALALKSYIMWKFPFLNRDIIYTFSIGEDWTGLQWLVENDSDTPNQQEVLRLLSSDQSSGSKKAALRKIGNGRAYNYIAERMLPKLRGGAAVSLHTKAAPQPAVVEKIKEIIVRDTLYIDRNIKQTMSEPETHVKKPLFALKTNLLFDALTALNVELEVPIGQRFSVAGEWIFPFWEFDPKHVLQTKTGILEARWWPGKRIEKPKLTGWFVGLYGGGGSFDFGWGDTGYQSMDYRMAGLSGGYAHTINRSGTLRMEYSLGVGYMHTDYSKYKPMLGIEGDWHLIRQKDGINRWVGPTRAKVSLVWMINGNFKQKGGSK